MFMHKTMHQNKGTIKKFSTKYIVIFQGQLITILWIFNQGSSQLLSQFVFLLL